MKILKKILCSINKRKNILFGNGFSIEKCYGCKWLIDWSNNIDKKMAYKLFEDEQITYLLNQIKIYKPEYFFDVGAHGGLYSIILKTNFPNLTIQSFEPDKQNRFQFYGNLFLNNLENDIKVQNYGLSSSSKNVTFGIQENQNRGGKTIQENGDNEILVKPLDEISLLKNKKCFLKIDVEGHQLDVVKGARRF